MATSAGTRFVNQLDCESPYRTIGVVDNVFGKTSVEEMRQALSPVRAHGDQISFDALRELKDTGFLKRIIVNVQCIVSERKLSGKFFKPGHRNVVGREVGRRVYIENVNLRLEKVLQILDPCNQLLLLFCFKGIRKDDVFDGTFEIVF